jgi:hypothetical protein
MTTLTNNNFKSTTIRGALYNKDYPDGSVLANAVFDRNLQVKQSLVLGDASGNALPTFSYYDASGVIHGIDLVNFGVSGGGSGGSLGYIDQLQNIYNQID